MTNAPAPLRVLVVTTLRGWTVSTRLLAAAGAGLAARGHVVTFVCCRRSATETELTRLYPDIPRRSISGSSSLARVGALRRIATTMRADCALVHTDRDLNAAAFAIARRGGVVRRLAIGERFEPSWRSRLAGARSRCLLMGDEIGVRVHEHTHVRTAVSWPPVVSADEARADLLRIEPTDGPPVLAVVAGTAALSVPSAERRAAQHVDGAVALRAIARLVTRHPDLRVLLVGDVSALQAMRLHAGSLGLAERITIVPVERLCEAGPFEASAAWVATQGDDGAVSILGAMQRRIPVVVPRGADTEGLVASRITGFVADESDLPGIVASLAQLLSDPEQRQAMGQAAAARAERLHGWDLYVDRVAETLRRASGARPT